MKKGHVYEYARSCDAAIDAINAGGDAEDIGKAFLYALPKAAQKIADECRKREQSRRDHAEYVALCKAGIC